MGIIKIRKYSKSDSYLAQHDEYMTECYCDKCLFYLGACEATYKTHHFGMDEKDHLSQLNFCQKCGNKLNNSRPKMLRTGGLSESDSTALERQFRDKKVEMFVDSLVDKEICSVAEIYIACNLISKSLNKYLLKSCAITDETEQKIKKILDEKG